jgi:carnitine-CoA ligase
MSPWTLGDVLEERLQRTPDSAFLHCGATTDRWVTLRELDERASRLAGGLAALGVSRGDRIALLMANRIEMIELLFAVAKLGAIQVPLNYWLKGEFLRYQLRDCGARVLVADGAGVDAAASESSSDGIQITVLVGDDTAARADVEYEQLLHHAPIVPVRTDPGDSISISYTSGTTADPKGCVLSTGYYVAAGRSYGERGWVVPDDRVYTSFPLFHASGQVVAFMSALVNDAAVAFAPEFHASSFIADAAAVETSMLIGVGATANAILDQPSGPDDRRRRFRLASWVPLSVARQREFEERFATPVMSEGYGQTECVPIAASYVDGRRRRATSGEVAPSIEVQVVADDGVPLAHGAIGELVVRRRTAQAMFSGYWDRQRQGAVAPSDGWHRTGDIGSIDEEGFVSFTDRAGDVIRRRGENVSSAHLETLLRDLPGVAEVAVCAVPAPLGDDDIKACLVETHRGAIQPMLIFDYLRDRVAYFAMPRFVHLHQALPVNALGRVMKAPLRQEGIPSECWDFERLGLVIPASERRGRAAARS